MPYKRRARRPYRKKKRFVKRKRAVKRYASPNFARMTTPFPYKLKTKLKYHVSENFAPTAISYAHNFNANSLYDPDRTGTGHQPMYYDQLCPGIYNRYRVTGFAYNITVSNTNTPVKAQAHFQNNNHSADYEDLGEMIGIKQTIINAMTAGGKCIGRLKGYTTCSRILGQGTNDDRDQAVYNASPSNVLVLGLLVNALDGSTNITLLNLDITFTYYCELFDRVVTGGS